MCESPNLKAGVYNGYWVQAEWSNNPALYDHRVLPPGTTDIFSSGNGQGVVSSGTPLVSGNDPVGPYLPTASSAPNYTVVSGEALSESASQGVLVPFSDPNGLTLSAEVQRGPTNGRLTLNADGSFTYVPAAGFVGSDSFVIDANDGAFRSNPLTVTLSVVPATPPSISAHTYDVTVGSPLVVGASGGVLAGSSDPQGLPLTAQVVTQPSHGSLSLDADGGFTYVPQSGFSGADTFTFDATDGVLTSDAATVTINVGSPPVAVPHAYWHLPGQPLTIAAAVGLLAGASDPNDLPLTAQLVQGPSSAFVSLQPDGSFTYFMNPTNDAGYNGPDSFYYDVTDGEFTSTPQRVAMQASVPPIASDETYTVGGGTATTIGVDRGVLLHDVDPAGLPLQAKLVAGPTSGGSVALSPDGSFTVTPAPGFAGRLTFIYQAFDAVASSNAATVTVNVTSPPVANDETYTITAGQTLHVPAPGVLSKDADPSGLPLSVASHGAPGSGTLAINPDGSFDYTPARGFSGLDSFTYVVTDGLASSNTARVDITVTPPPPPIAINHAYTTTVGQALHVPAPGILGGDTDPSGLPLFVQSHGTPAFGILSLNRDGSFNYTPFAGFSGIDSFVYTISDGTGLTASATISITVRAQPQPQPQPPHVLGISGAPHSRKGLTSIDVVFDEALNAISAQDGGYTLLLGIKRRRHVIFSKSVGIRSIEYDGNTHTVALNLAKPAKGPVQVTVRKGIAAANGAMSIADFSAIVN